MASRTMSDKDVQDVDKLDSASHTINEAEAGVEHSQHVDPDLYIDPKEEKALLRKVDVWLLSIFGLLYLLCFLDRGNIGSANVATPSISQALNLTPQQYSACVSIVYATYVVFEPMWANLLKILSPKFVLSGCTLIWGTLTLCTAWAGNYSHMIAIRLLLGFFEAGLFPCLTVYIMMTYRREELGRRMSYIFSCAAFAGAVGGLIGYGLVRIETGSVVGWQWLYILEGVLTLCLAPIAYFWVPNRLTDAWFLNKHEKDLAAKRYLINKRTFDDKEQFRWSEVFKALRDWKVYTSGCIQFIADVTLYGISTFMPQIIRAMGFSNVMAQALTVPVYVFGGVFFIIMAHISDKILYRSPFIIFGLSLSLIGYIILATAESVGARYFALYVIAAGLYTPVGTNIVWIGGSVQGHFKRSTAVGINQLMGNSSGAAIGSIFLTTLAPRYFRSMYICMGLTALGIVITVVQAAIYHMINKKREEMVRNGAEDRPELGDENPHFRFML